MTICAEIEAVRVQARAGIMGEPAVEIPPDHLHWYTGQDGEKHVVIRLDNLIALVKNVIVP